MTKVHVAKFDLEGLASPVAMHKVHVRQNPMYVYTGTHVNDLRL